MSDNLNEAILDKITKTCRCTGVTRAKIKAAIKNGADTLEKVQKTTGAGTGSCKGSGCSYIIENLIKESKENTDC